MARLVEEYAPGWLGGGVPSRYPHHRGLTATGTRAMRSIGGGADRSAFSEAYPDAGRNGESDLSSMPADAQLRPFHAQAIVEQENRLTIVGGRFTPADPIDLALHDVNLTVSGARVFRLSLLPASFIETGLNGYVAADQCGSVKIDLLLQPFTCGDWAYSVAIEGFDPKSAAVVVRLTVGTQTGAAPATVYQL